MSNRYRRARRRKVFIGLAVFVSLLLLALAVGAYPLAIVNGRIIWASSFRTYIASALSYQEAVRDTYTPSSTRLLAASAQSAQALGAVALDELIDQALISEGLEEKVGDNADRLRDLKIIDLRDDPNLPGAARALFQLDPGSFTTAILRPQAEREVLSGRLYLENTALDTWLATERKEARVYLLSGTYTWTDTLVRVRQ